MRTDRYLARAPSNIALIKYMGKADATRNLPMNPSLSLTLDRFCTFAEVSDLRTGDGAVIVDWRPEAPVSMPAELAPLCQVPDQSATARAKIAKFAARLRDELPAVFRRHGLAFHPLRSATLRTANTFPAGTGLASSASAFAAVTVALAAAQSADRAAYDRVFRESTPFRAELASLSRLGSGSSCRSFLGPWCAWQEDRVMTVPSRLPEYADLVMLIGTAPKAVSSSEAHRRVTSSPSWASRPATASARWHALRDALADGDTERVADLAWQDSWDMHHLFHTAVPPFSYWEPRTFAVLRWLMDTAPGNLPRPIVTLDAGPNLHLLVPLAGAAGWKDRLQGAFGDIEILQDRQGRGAELIHGE